MAHRLRLARWTFLATAALAAVSLAIFGIVMAAVTSGDASHDYLLAQRGDDYLLATAPLAPSDADVYGAWSTSLGAQPPDHILVVPFEDLNPLLAGQAPPHVLARVDKENFSEKMGGYYSVAQGELFLHVIQSGSVLEGTGYSFPFACGNCSVDPRLAIVWVHGDSWAGTSFSALQRGTWGVDARGHATGDAPILWRGLYVEHNFIDWFEWLFGAPYVLGALALAAGLWWGLESWLDRRARPPPAEPPEVGTDDLLRLVRLSERYLDALWRYQIGAGVAIAVGVAALAAFVVPALLAAARRVFLDPFDADVIILLAPAVLGVLAFAVWGMVAARLRAERRRWRGLREELDAAEARILAP